MSFAALYEETYARIYAYAYRHTGNRADAEELTGAIYKAAQKAWPRFEHQGRPVLAWLYTIADRALKRLGKATAAAEPEAPRPEHKAELAEWLLGEARRRAEAKRPASGGEPVRYTIVSAEPLGPAYLAYTARGICYLTTATAGEAEFVAAVRSRYGCEVVRDDSQQGRWQGAVEGWLAGRQQEVLLDLSGVTPFERTVLQKAQEIRRGEVRPYQWLAKELGKPGASRAIGGAMARNPVPLFVPCHRVVAASGVIGNYSMGGPTVKRLLLELEGVDVDRLRDLIRPE